MFVRHMRLLLVITATALLLSCGSEREWQNSSSGTGRVYISLGSGMNATETLKRAITSRLPSDITNVIVTCTADGISPVTGNLPMDGTPLLLEVPEGANRFFTVDAYSEDLLRMTGSATVSYIYAGSQITVAITLKDLATLIIMPETVTVRIDETQQFSYSVTAHIDNTVTWSINGIDGGDATVGTIDDNGFYTAPSLLPTPATVTVRATSNADSTLYAEVAVKVAAIEQISDTCLGEIVTVNSTADTIDANLGDGICDDGLGNCTLRAAIQETNACPGADEINIPAGTYILTLAGIDENSGATGDLDIADDLSISGAGATETIIDGNALDRVFHTYDIMVEIAALTIRNGMASTDSGGGGLLITAGTLTVRDATISGNSAPATPSTGVGNGGGIYCILCTLNITNSTISGNAAQGSNWAVGGGILKTGSGIVNILNSTISGNTAAFYGGGIQINGGTTNITNSTVTNNSANFGGGGAYVKFFNNGAVINLQNTIIADQVNGGDCGSDNGSSPFPFTAAGDSIDSDGSCAEATISSNLLLDPLAYNGGPTQTHALLTGSPAIDAGDNAICPSTDQRGVARYDGLCDIGAFERGATINTSFGTLGGSSSRAYGISADGNVVVGYSDITGDSAWHAFRWTQAGGMMDLGTLGGGTSSTAYNSSADGSVVVGYSMINSSDYHAFLWTQAGGMIDLGTLGGTKSFAFSVSDDGSVVVGSSRRSDNLEHAFIWTQAEGMIDLGTLLTGTTSRAYDVSADGGVVVGYSYISDTSLTRHAFRWTQGSGMTDLGTLGGTESGAAAISADGSVVVGYSDITGDSESHAFRWTQAVGMNSLGTLGGFYSGAAAISANGSVVVGDSYTGSDYLGFQWTEATGMQSVVDWLINESVIVPAGWTLYGAFGISADGSVVVGTGYDTSGNSQVWLGLVPK